MQPHSKGLHAPHRSPHGMRGRSKLQQRMVFYLCLVEFVTAHGPIRQEEGWVVFEKDHVMSACCMWSPVSGGVRNHPDPAGMGRLSTEDSSISWALGSVRLQPSKAEWTAAKSTKEEAMTHQAAQVMPNIYVQSVDDVRKFYMEKLGFQHVMGMVGRDGSMDFCIITLNGASIMPARPMEKIEGTAPASKRPVEIYISVPNVDAYHDEVKKQGATIVTPLSTQWWGDRNFAVTDPVGYKVWFFQTVGQIDAPPGVKIV